METMYRLLQDGVVVASSNSEREIRHYALMYGRDGPVTIQTRWGSGKWRNMSHD